MVVWKDQKTEAIERFDILVSLEQSGFTPTGAPPILATEFRHGGRTYTQIKRDGNVALYKLSGAGYEVVVVRRQKPKVIHGVYYPEREVMPDISVWGKYGWTYLAGDLAGAEKRYQSLLPKWGIDRPVGLSTSRILEEAYAGGIN
jgi:hypothetical protein